MRYRMMCACPGSVPRRRRTLLGRSRPKSSRTPDVSSDGLHTQAAPRRRTVLLALYELSDGSKERSLQVAAEHSESPSEHALRRVDAGCTVAQHDIAHRSRTVLLQVHSRAATLPKRVVYRGTSPSPQAKGNHEHE